LQLPASEDELRRRKLSRTGRWKDSEYLTVRVRSNIFRIPLRCIFYFEKSYRKINIASEEGVFTFYGKLENLMDMLTDNFIRCHSYIVNFDKVITMESSHLNFSKRNACEDMKTRVPVSRTYYSDIRNRFDE
ncbi:MAG: LytTR family DNA-binding domain-containing protein, partial [Anaerovoracaceae bacterium]